MSTFMRAQLTTAEPEGPDLDEGKPSSGDRPGGPGQTTVASILAAMMKSFSDSPPTACVHSVTSTSL